MLLTNGTILDGSFKLRKADLRICEDKIESIGMYYDDKLEIEDELNVEGKIIIPGLIDIHTHGCVGCDTCDATLNSMKRISEAMAQHGSTSFLPTTMTLPGKELKPIVENVKRYAENPTSKSANILGINLEGPFLSQGKRGAHRKDWVISPDIALFNELYQLSGGMIRMVDIAPEREGAFEFIDQVKDRVTVSIAHTETDYDTAMRAISRGIRNATHMFNAMPPFNHREPGAIGAIFDSNVTAELISDGIHLHPSVVRTAFKALTSHRAVLISDSIRGCGMPDGIYDLGGQEITVKNHRVTLADGTIAGGSSYLYDNVIKAISFGIPFEDAVRAATRNPAKAIGMQNKLGSIEVGKYADLLILDKEYRLERVILRGRLL